MRKRLRRQPIKRWQENWENIGSTWEEYPPASQSRPDGVGRVLARDFGTTLIL